jgi:hypothetical protein
MWDKEEEQKMDKPIMIPSIFISVNMLQCLYCSFHKTRLIEKKIIYKNLELLLDYPQ